jgi:hypothetical protein
MAGTVTMAGPGHSQPRMRSIEPMEVMTAKASRKTRLRIVLAAFVVVSLAGAAVWSQLLGARGQVTAVVAGGLATPPPAALVAGTSLPTTSPDPTPSGSVPALAVPSASPPGSPKTSTIGPVDINLARNGKAVFSSQITKEMCASAGLTSALATMGLVKASNAVQRSIEKRIGAWTSYADSHNGGWGPLAMTKALAAYGASGYVVKTFGSRRAALRAAGIALSATHEPVLLLAWWGAHTWVMTGYRATGDLAADTRAAFTGAYIVDPWYPRVSSIWGHVNPPGHFYDMAGLIHNYIAWTRPEGRYPGRDRRWVAVIPTRPLAVRS